MGSRMRRHSPEPPRSRRVWLVPAIGVACIAVGFLTLHSGPNRPGTEVKEMPRELVGRWTTADARYRGRALSLTRDSVILETGPGQASRRGRILSMRTWREGLVPVLRIEYDAGDGRETMDLLLVAPDSLRLRNPRDVLWTKERDPSGGRRR